MTIVELVERERARMRMLEVAAGAALGIAVAGGLLAAGGLLLGQARWLALPRGVPLAIWLLLAAAMGAVVRITMRRLASRTSRAQVAAAIERERALRSGALRGAIEVADAGPFGRRAAALIADALPKRGQPLAPEMRGGATRRASKFAAAALLTTVSLAIVAPLRGDGLMAILRPVRAWRGTLLAPLAFDRLPATVMRGDTIRVTISAAGRTTVDLQDRTTGEGWTRRTLTVSPRSGLATITLGPLRGDLSMLLTDGRAHSDTAVVRVADRPFVGAITMRAEYPAYLDRPAETLPVGEPVVVPRGTTIALAGRASMPLATVGVTQGRDSVRLHPEDRAFSGPLSPSVTGRWNWYARGTNAAVEDLPSPIDVTVVPDSAPRVDILAPQADTLVAALDTVTLQGAAADDHGLSLIELHMWRVGPGGAVVSASRRVAANPGAAWGGSTLIDLSAQRLSPGDALHLTLSAVDNSPWAQRGTSRELLLKVPSLEERRAIARAAADSTVHAVQQAATSEQSLQQRTSEAARQGMNQPVANPQSPNDASTAPKQNPLSYESAEKARALANEQHDLADRVKQLQQSAAQLKEQLKQAGALDSTLSRQLRDAQQMLHDALTPELLAEMQKLQSATQRLDGAQAQQSLANLAEMQKKLREQLEKSAQMLQRAAFEGAMQTLHDEATDIATRERALRDSTPAPSSVASRHDSAGTAARDSSSGASPPAAQQGARDMSRELADRSDRLASAIQQLQQKLADDNAHAGARNSDDAHTFAKASEQSMRQRADTQSAADEMQRAAQAMQQARDAQVSEWKNELTSEIDRAVQELLQMSRQESKMEDQARSGQATTERLRGDQSAVQQGVEQTQRQLQQQAQKTTLLSGRSQRAMSDAADKVAQATKLASDPRRAAQTPAAMSDAADALNQAAAALARDRQSANASGSASGFAEMLQRLQDAAKKQGSINAQAQGLMPIPGQGPMSPGAQATARMLANEERRLSQELDDLSDAAGGDRAAQLAKEARAVAQTLDGGRVDAATVARQEQLLQHMLDAGRSLQKDERDDSGKREAESAKNPQLFSPENHDASGRSAVKYPVPTWDELRGLSADERRAILEYFKRINGGTRP